MRPTIWHMRPRTYDQLCPLNPLSSLPYPAQLAGHSLLCCHASRDPNVSFKAHSADQVQSRQGWQAQRCSLRQLREGHARTRRQLVLQGISWPVLAGLLPSSISAFLDERPPERGSCPTCIGVVDGTLGSCASAGPCMSSYDDRPGHFIAPWAHEERSSERALDRIEVAVMKAGGSVQERTESYLYATFTSPLGTDDLEFLLREGDTTVELRAASRQTTLPDLGRLEGRFEDLRRRCGFENVPVLRNRKRVLGVVESPWDQFGPTPPTDLDFSNLDGF